MVLWAITEFALEAGIWSAGKVYNAGYWLIWGTPKTEAEKLIDEMLKQQVTIEQLHTDLQEVTTRLREIEVEEKKEVKIVEEIKESLDKDQHQDQENKEEQEIKDLDENPDAEVNPSETHDTSSCTT